MTTNAFDDSAPQDPPRTKTLLRPRAPRQTQFSRRTRVFRERRRRHECRCADTNAGADTNADAEMNAQSHAVPVPQFRTGIGFDTHAFAEPDSGRKMMMACLEWPGEWGWKATRTPTLPHTRAAMRCWRLQVWETSAPTSAPPRPEWAGAPGEALMRETVRLVNEAGYEIVNVSVQIIGERPASASAAPKLKHACPKSLAPPLTLRRQLPTSSVLQEGPRAWLASAPR